MNSKRLRYLGSLALLASVGVGCGGSDTDASEQHGAAGRPGGPGGGGPPGMHGAAEQAAVPVEVTPVIRRDISSFIETNGTLEAENEVDLVARTAGPIVELNAEENMAVKKGQLLARLDQDQIRAQLEISRVELEDARSSFDRAQTLHEANLVSNEEFDQARARLESAQAQFSGNEIQLGYTEIRAPFDGLIVRRYVKFAETVANTQALFRLSDFTPLLCPIQVPERELPRLRKGQSAYLTVEAWPGERFEARVLRLSPVVDAATGTVKVTLDVDPRGKLRPGMFASVYLQTETHEGVLVIPRTALALDSIGDTVFVASNGTAERREVTLGYREGDSIEIVSGVREGEKVVSVGQDSLADGTPIQVLGPVAESMASSSAGGGGGFSPEQIEAFKQRMRERGMTEEQIEERIQQFGQGGGPGGRPQGQAAGAAPPASAVGGGASAGGPRDPSAMSPEQLESLKQRMRDRGMTEEQIEERIQQFAQGGGPGGRPQGQAPGAPPPSIGAGGGGPGGGPPDPSAMSPEQLESLKQRMRDRGMSDEEIEERLEQLRERAAVDSESDDG